MSVAQISTFITCNWSFCHSSNRMTPRPPPAQDLCISCPWSEISPFPASLQPVLLIFKDWNIALLPESFSCPYLSWSQLLSFALFIIRLFSSQYLKLIMLYLSAIVYMRMYMYVCVCNLSSPTLLQASRQWEADIDSQHLIHSPVQARRSIIIWMNEYKISDLFTLGKKINHLKKGKM